MHKNVENSTASTGIKTSNINIKLPEILLPKFLSNFEEWEHF